MWHVAAKPVLGPTAGAAGRLTRRQFVQGAAGLSLSMVGLALVAGCGSLSAPRAPGASEVPPETKTLKITQLAAICSAPMHLAAAETLPGEGFTDVQYTRTAASTESQDALAAGKSDIALNFVGSLIMRVDAGDPIVMLAGSHPGCAELFGTNQVRAIRDLKGKTVAVPELGAGSMQHLIVASMATYVGIDPSSDINFVVHPQDEAMRLLAEGSIDAYLGFPPTAHQLRAQKVGHLIVNTMMDRPWSQYFCCVIAGNREFVRSNPAATRRAVRALLRANQFCAHEPDRVARFLVDNGYTPYYDYARDAIKETAYGSWRDFDAEDTVRFWSLRLHEAGMIKSSPDKILAQGTDWRFFNELKQELKG